jgi:hypothetical protein
LQPVPIEEFRLSSAARNLYKFYLAFFLVQINYINSFAIFIVNLFLN